MDNYRLILFGALALIVMLLWQAWEKEHAQLPAISVNNTTTAGGPEKSASIHADDLSVPQAPEAPREVPSTATPTPLPQQQPKRETGQRITVVTDIFRAEIDTQGGDLHRLWLLKHPVSVDQPKEPFPLFQEGTTVLITQSGLIGQKGSYPTHKAKYSTKNTHYELEPGKDELRVPLSWRGPDGMEYTKVFIFKRGSYVVGVDYVVKNTTKKEWNGFFYGQIVRSYVKRRGLFSLPTYTGGATYTPEEKYRKVSFDNMNSKPLKVESTDGWVAMLQHYFVAAWIAKSDERHEFYTHVLPNQLYAIGTKDLTPTRIAPGQTGHIQARLYAGPKEHKRLKAVAPSLELTVDYGYLTIISAPLFWLLTKIHGLVGNWGWAIVILTVLIKLAFYPLSATSYKSMAQMKKLQPKIQSLKERYSDDRQKMNQAMMELYKTEKINPLGGCLPILIQIPVFIALYWVLLESVEMRQAPFILWIRDLSIRDPYFVLPLIMGASMYAQQVLNPQSPDPMQRRIFMLMPIVFTGMFLFFPAGLVLYWVVNNSLSILQQWRINRVITAKGG